VKKSKGFQNRINPAGPWSNVLHKLDETIQQYSKEILRTLLPPGIFENIEGPKFSEVQESNLPYDEGTRPSESKLALVMRVAISSGLRIFVDHLTQIIESILEKIIHDQPYDPTGEKRECNKRDFLRYITIIIAKNDFKSAYQHVVNYCKGLSPSFCLNIIYDVIFIMMGEVKIQRREFSYTGALIEFSLEQGREILNLIDFALSLPPDCISLNEQENLRMIMIDMRKLRVSVTAELNLLLLKDISQTPFIKEMIEANKTLIWAGDILSIMDEFDWAGEGPGYLTDLSCRSYPY
jgi:hypothetical protein